MHDGFHELHTKLVFRDQPQVCVSETAFRMAQVAAAKDLDAPNRGRALMGNESYDRHRQFYELHLKGGMDAYSDLSHRVDRALVEVVVLHNFLRKEETGEKNNTYPVKRSIAVLGWMIQERLHHILLQTGNNSFLQLMKLRQAYGIVKDNWETRLVGASAESKAMMLLSRVKELRLYPATLFEDVELGIDFFIEMPEGTGACVSVKTDVGGTTRFLFESAAGYKEAWTRISVGTERFRCKYTQDWRPILILVGKPRGENINLAQVDAPLGGWRIIRDILTKKPALNELVLTA